MSAQYLGSVAQKLGRETADRTIRLYILAGGAHNVGGTSQIKALAMLENWLLKGRAPPDDPVAYNLGVEDMRFISTMPACRFPAYPHYSDGDRSKLPASVVYRRKACH
jgi:Tannase and feruloyl esterase